MPRLPDLNLITELIAVGRRNRPGTVIRPTHVTIHNTDNDDAGADARAHSGFVRNTGYYMVGERRNYVSWHFTVDDNVAIRHLPINELGYHAGRGNAVSVAIEICMNRGINQVAVNERAALLTAGLIRQLGISQANVVTHKSWTNKACPSQLLNNRIEGQKWRDFLALVAQFVSDLDQAGSPDLIARDAIESAPAEAVEDLPVEAIEADIDHELVRKQMQSKEP